MSNPPPTSPPLPLVPSSHHHHQQQQQPPPHFTTTTTTTTIREYRKGNWTIQETLTLISAKKINDERRNKSSTLPSSKPGELKWKWVENFCWAHGCFRSQNQCNDKWDNLLRDYKKVREYQSRSQSNDSDHHLPSYFTMERHQRKDKNLPSNMSVEVFEALNEVVQRRYSSTTNVPQQTSTQLSPAPLSFRPPPVDVSERSDSSGTESSDKQDFQTKRTKVGKIGSSIMQSASVLAQALENSEEKKERRHQELMELEQRRLKIEETRNEVNQQGTANLVTAMTNLSGAIQSLISNYYDQT